MEEGWEGTGEWKEGKEGKDGWREGRKKGGWEGTGVVEWKEVKWKGVRRVESIGREGIC